MCLSVCLSVISRFSNETAKRRITQTTPHDSQWGTLVSDAKDLGKTERGHPTAAEVPNAAQAG